MAVQPPPAEAARRDPERQDHRFPCDACGADLRFDPGGMRLVCDHCGNVEALGDIATPTRDAIPELDFRAALADQLPQADLEETQVLSCTNCGAQVEFEPAIHAAECPFCATPVVTGTGTDRHIKPKGVLPFALDERAASEAMKRWLGRLWFAPSGLTRYARRGSKMDGIYIPYWTFDARTQSRYRGQRGTIYYETRRVRRGGETRTETVARVRWRGASGAVARDFDDVLVIGSRSLPPAFADGLMPWDLSSLAPYNPEFVAGFRAEAYRVELDEAFHVARGHMDRVIERDVRFDIGGDRQRIDAIDTSVSNVTFKHLLLPVWIAAYRYGGKSYQFVVNGQTGRVQGERPWSVWKIATAIVVAVMLAAALALGAAFLEGGGMGSIPFDPTDF